MRRTCSTATAPRLFSKKFLECNFNADIKSDTILASVLLTFKKSLKIEILVAFTILQSPSVLSCFLNQQK